MNKKSYIPVEFSPGVYRAIIRGSYKDPNHSAGTYQDSPEYRFTAVKTHPEKPVYYVSVTHTSVYQLESVGGPSEDYKYFLQESSTMVADIVGSSSYDETTRSCTSYTCSNVSVSSTKYTSWSSYRQNGEVTSKETTFETTETHSTSSYVHYSFNSSSYNITQINSTQTLHRSCRLEKYNRHYYFTNMDRTMLTDGTVAAVIDDCYVYDTSSTTHQIFPNYISLQKVHHYNITESDSNSFTANGTHETVEGVISASESNTYSDKYGKATSINYLLTSGTKTVRLTNGSYTDTFTFYDDCKAGSFDNAMITTNDVISFDGHTESRDITINRYWIRGLVSSMDFYQSHRTISLTVSDLIDQSIDTFKATYQNMSEIDFYKE